MPWGIDKQYASVIWATLLYCAWNYRSGKLFGSGKKMDEAIFDFERIVDEMSEKYVSARGKRFLNGSLCGLIHGLAT